MSLNANAIVSLAEGKAFLEENGNAKDTLIERLINSISTQIEAAVARKVAQQTLTAYRMDGNGSTSMRFPHTPLKSISSLVSKSPVDDTTLTTFTSFSIINPNTGNVLLTAGEVFPCGRDNIVATMSVGYATSPAEDNDLSTFKLATLMQLKNNFKRYESQEIGLLGHSMPNGAVTLAPPRGLLLEVLEMIRPFTAQRLA
jgi:hypothetical protein